MQVFPRLRAAVFTALLTAGAAPAWAQAPRDWQLSFQTASAESFIEASTLLIQEFADIPLAL